MIRKQNSVITKSNCGIAKLNSHPDNPPYAHCKAKERDDEELILIPDINVTPNARLSSLKLFLDMVPNSFADVDIFASKAA